MKYSLIRLLILALGFVSLIAATPAYAATDAQLFKACNINGKTINSPICQEAPGTKTNPVMHALKVTTDIVALATGAVAVIMVILGGVNMISSAGNPEAVKNSRRRIIYALIGMLIVVLAWTIVSYAIDKLIKT